MKYLSVFIMCILMGAMGCKHTDIADSVIINANIYAVDTTYDANAIAIKGDRIWKIGKWEALEPFTDENTQIIDAQGHFVMPGFIEGHGHYNGLGKSLMNLNFLNAKSWESIVDDVAEKVKETPAGTWIIGRGWHQEKWDSVPARNIYKYPFHDALSRVSPDNPVVLYHASGHALFANQKAMSVVGITKETPNPVGGEIVRDINGEAIGVFEERAMDIFNNKYDEYIASLDPKVLDSIWLAGFKLAENECLKYGVTSFEDAGSSFSDLNKYKKLAEDGKMRVRLWAMMLEPEDSLATKAIKYKAIDVGNHFYTCNAIKCFVDGALGSFGAWLLEPYSDKRGFTGQNTTDLSELKRIADMAIKDDVQLCVHAIGDRANREVLNIYEEVFKNHPDKKDLRWRIEHAQHLHPDDMKRFVDLGVIASIQAIHCTSDAPFVVQRLGEERARTGAYPWRSLLDLGVTVMNGTDVPVEHIDPFRNFYAAVTRKREDTGMAFFPEQKMTREEAIKAYTLSNAYGAFQEDVKGSLRVGKLADIIILDHDLIHCTDEEILDTKVLYTIVGGKIEYQQ